MTKQEKIEKRRINSMLKRDRDALKSAKISVSLLKVNDLEKALSECKSQASLIQTSLNNNKTLSETIENLIRFKFYDNAKDAQKRVMRHINNDKQSRIVNRTIHLNERLNNAMSSDNVAE